MFDYKFRNAPAVSGSQIFLVPSMLNEFERMYAAHLASKRSEGSISTLLQWIKEKFPDALDRFELGTKEDLAIFVKYVQNKKSPDQSTLLIFEKIKEMNLV
jgi:hypothetical protein